MGVTYSREQKSEAVALARVVGVTRAADQLKIDPRTISSWLAAAGVSAGDSELDTDELARFERLAYARLESELVGGQMRGNRLAVTWGIVRDKLDRRAREPKPEPKPERTEVDDWADAIEALAATAYPVMAHRIPFLLAHLLGDLGDAPAPDPIEAWAEAVLADVPDDRDGINAWWAEHDAICPSVKRSDPYTPKPDAELAELLAQADRAIAQMEMTP